LTRRPHSGNKQSSPCACHPDVHVAILERALHPRRHQHHLERFCVKGPCPHRLSLISSSKIHPTGARLPRNLLDDGGAHFSGMISSSFSASRSYYVHSIALAWAHGIPTWRLVRVKMLESRRRSRQSRPSTGLGEMLRTWAIAALRYSSLIRRQKVGLMLVLGGTRMRVRVS
jgi:hypothetical protein